MSAQLVQPVEAWHIVPMNDLREHTLSPDCWCEPELDESEREDFYIHNAADEREKFESGVRLVS